MIEPVESFESKSTKGESNMDISIQDRQRVTGWTPSIQSGEQLTWAQRALRSRFSKEHGSQRCAQCGKAVSRNKACWTCNPEAEALPHRQTSLVEQPAPQLRDQRQDRAAAAKEAIALVAKQPWHLDIAPLREAARIARMRRNRAARKAARQRRAA
jgi:hypothetical protein